MKRLYPIKCTMIPSLSKRRLISICKRKSVTTLFYICRPWIYIDFLLTNWLPTCKPLPLFRLKSWVKVLCINGLLNIREYGTSLRYANTDTLGLSIYIETVSWLPKCIHGRLKLSKESSNGKIEIKKKMSNFVFINYISK